MTAADGTCKCPMTAIRLLPVLHHSADYIFHSFGIIEPLLVTLKIEYRFNRCLWGGGGDGMIFSCFETKTKTQKTKKKL